MEGKTQTQALNSFGTNTEAAVFADAVWLDLATFVSEGKSMLAMTDALSGQPLKQGVTVDMSDAAGFGKQQPDELRKGLLQCFSSQIWTQRRKSQLHMMRV
jgi:hypothetical protein